MGFLKVLTLLETSMFQVWEGLSLSSSLPHEVWHWRSRVSYYLVTFFLFSGVQIYQREDFFFSFSIGQSPVLFRTIICLSHFHGVHVDPEERLILSFRHSSGTTDTNIYLLTYIRSFGGTWPKKDDSMALSI